MQNNEWWVSYPYCLMCPAYMNQYGYENQKYQNFYRFDGEDFDDLEEFFEDESFGNVFSEDNILDDTDGEFEKDFDETRTPQDIDRVIRIINQRAARDIGEIVRIGMDRKLLDFFIRTMVSYIDRNYNRYKGTKQQKVDMAVRDIRRDLPWIFEIMNLYSVSPATQARLLDTVVTASIESLRMPPATPPSPAAPVPPMPR